MLTVDLQLGTEPVRHVQADAAVHGGECRVRSKRGERRVGSRTWSGARRVRDRARRLGARRLGARRQGGRDLGHTLGDQLAGAIIVDAPVRRPDPVMFLGYWNAPEKTAAAWRDTADGPAFTVGDLGRIDEEGFLYLEGRREDLVISGGVNVYPVEVEHVLTEHPGVTEVAVFGVDDERWGQRVCAAVVGTATAAELSALAAERLSPAKRPFE